MIPFFNVAVASCQIWCLSLLYLATEIWALVMPLMMGSWVGSWGRGAMTTVPLGVALLFAPYASHSASVSIWVSSPVG